MKIRPNKIKPNDPKNFEKAAHLRLPDPKDLAMYEEFDKNQRRQVLSKMKRKSEALNHDWFANSAQFLVASYLSMLTVIGISLTLLNAAYQKADLPASDYKDLVSGSFEAGFLVTFLLLGLWVTSVLLGQQRVKRRERLGIWIDELQHLCDSQAPVRKTLRWFKRP